MFEAMMRVDFVEDETGKRETLFHRRVDGRVEADREALENAYNAQDRCDGEFVIYGSGKKYEWWDRPTFCPWCHAILTDEREYVSRRGRSGANSLLTYYCRGTDCRYEHYKHERNERLRDERTANRPPRDCEYCGDEFQPKRNDARFCCAKCRVYANREQNR